MSHNCSLVYAIFNVCSFSLPKFIAKIQATMLATKTRTLLALVALGDAARIGSFLFVPLCPGKPE
jgi:hypothetical protein